MEISGKLAIITGASRGTGAATAIALSNAGAKVILVARTEADLVKVRNVISKNGGEAIHYAVDLSNTNAIYELVSQIKAEHGVPDIVVNNAGLGRWLFVEETPPEEAEMMIRLPYMAAWHLTRAFLPEMLERGSGHFVHVNSPACITPFRGANAYSASRCALKGFAQGLYYDLKGTGVGTSHLVAGKVNSAYFDSNPGSEERLPGISKIIPTLSTEKCAGYIVKAIRRNKKQMVRPFLLWMFYRMHRYMPWVVELFVYGTGYKRKS